MDIEQFKEQFAENLRKNILKNFKTQKEFADFFDESTKVVSTWCGGKALPDLYKIYRICESMGITIDYLIKGEPDNLTNDSIDYDIFNEVVKLVNEFSKKIKLKEPTGKRYLAIYENVQNIKRLNRQITTKMAFNTLIPTMLELID